FLDTAVGSYVKLFAVKKLTFGRNRDVKKLVERFDKEIEILRKLKHPNIVNLISFVKMIEKERAWLIFPWASRGNVKQFLQTGNWEIPERVALIEDVSRGLSFLHTQNPPICHGDLKSLNIVVDQDFKAIIVDFGSARTVSSRKAKRPRPGRRLQPTLAVQAAGHSTDSIQSLISTIITDHMPFHQISNDSCVVLRIMQGELPPVRTNKKLAQLRTMCTLLMRCWEEKSMRRPTATECLEVIEQLPSARPSKIAIDHEIGERVRSAALWNALGELNFDIGSCTMALHQFNKSLEISKSENDNKLSSLVHRNLGDIHYIEGRWEDAVDAYEESQRLALLGGLERLDETSLCRLMDSYTELGWLHEAQELFDNIVIDPHDGQGWEDVVESSYKLGKASYELGQYERAIVVYERARNIHQNKQEYTEPLYSLHHSAILYCLYGRYADAKRIFEKLKIVQDPPLEGMSSVLIALRTPVRLLYCEERGDWADVLVRFVSICTNEGRYNDALAVYNEIWHIRELQGRKKEVADTLKCIGHLYVDLERYKEAESVYKEGHAISRDEGDQLGTVKFLLCIAEVYCIGGLYDDAVRMHQQAGRICYMERLGELYVDTVNRLGEVYRWTERYEEAVESFREAREFAALVDYPNGKADALRGLRLTFAGEGDYEEAMKRLKRAASVFRNSGDTESLLKCNLAIQEIEEMDSEQAIE
ncbi:hypothetical protein FRC01_007105, partial [Tulasnella sp. 417]